ncbi:MAG: hypothetical protein KC594_18150 [Nitrospira sp.]|nr:hypothetical protein [Nitrospira sp.]
MLKYHTVSFLAVALAACQPKAAGEQSDHVSPEVLALHDYSLADTPNERTALAYLYTAWNDGQIRDARLTYWSPGSFPDLEAEAAADSPPEGLPIDLPVNVGSPTYTIKKVFEDDDHVIVLAFVEGVGIGEEFTTVFGTPGGTKIGDAVVEIFRFDDDGLIAEKWDTIEPLSEQTYDFR